MTTRQALLDRHLRNYIYHGKRWRNFWPASRYVNTAFVKFNRVLASDESRYDVSQCVVLTDVAGLWLSGQLANFILLTILLLLRGQNWISRSTTWPRTRPESYAAFWWSYRATKANMLHLLFAMLRCVDVHVGITEIIKHYYANFKLAGCLKKNNNKVIGNRSYSGE